MSYYQRLAKQIELELEQLSRVINRITMGWQQAQTTADDLYVDSVALNIHGFYAGVERLFERVATKFDGQMPQGANWHQQLLNQMANEIPAMRPAVITIDSQNKLDPYRGFRHIVRNVYTFNFDPDKVAVLVSDLPAVFAQIKVELQAFADFLRQLEER